MSKPKVNEIEKFRIAFMMADFSKTPIEVWLRRRLKALVRKAFVHGREFDDHATDEFGPYIFEKDFGFKP